MLRPFDEGGSVRLAEVAERYRVELVARARPRTVKESAAILARIIQEIGVETVGELSRARVKAWRERRLAGGASNKTANNALAVLLAALACAVESELIPAHPLAGLRSLPVGPRHQRRRPRALAEWEIAKLLAALADMDAHPPPEQCPRVPQELLVRVLLETGARCPGDRGALQPVGHESVARLAPERDGALALGLRVLGAQVEHGPGGVHVGPGREGELAPGCRRWRSWRGRRGSGKPWRTRPKVDILEDVEAAELAVAADEPEPEYDAGELDALGWVLAQLTERERVVLRGRFFEGRTLRSVAADLGVGFERVRQIHERALRRARELMERRARNPSAALGLAHQSRERA